MVSRETRVHVVAVLLGLLALVGFGWWSGGTAPTWIEFGVLVVYNGLVFGGAHLYLALRGDGEAVPLDARWRFLGFLAVWVSLLGAMAVAGPAEVGGVAVFSVLGVAMLIAFAAYFLFEARSGYGDFEA